MENAHIINGLLLPFRIEGFHWSIYSLINLAMAGCCSAGLWTASRRQLIQLARPALIVALLVHIIFQWPLALFSPIIEKSLPLYWLFAFSVHIHIVACLVWVVLTPSLSDKMIPSGKLIRAHPKGFSAWSHAILFMLTICLTGVYLSRVNLRCTGLYAALADPGLTLLARELSGKLIGSGLASYGFGLLANVICPLLIFASIDRIQNALSTNRWAPAIIWLFSGLAALMVVLLPGSKGALIPTIIVVGVSSLSSQRTRLGRILVVACVISMGLIVMTTFEMLRERKVITGKGYQFGVCAARMNLCSEAKTLLDSLGHHDTSLGINLIRREKLASELDRACFSAIQQSGHFLRKSGINSIYSRPAAFTPEAGPAFQNNRSIAGTRNPAAFAAVTAVKTPSIPRSIHLVKRIWQYTQAIVYRVAVVPLQVASWYYLYTIEYGSPGVNALPLADILFGHRVIMPKRIHEVYYPVYSLGDKTATGTAPTSFMMAYPAYLGFAGIGLSLAALFAFDLVASIVIGKVGNSLRWAGIGLVIVGCINLMLSDFGTTLLSHGTAFALLLLLVLSFIEKKSHPISQ